MTSPLQFLDIDLDAFVEPTEYWPEGGRLDETEFSAWAEDRVRDFLETRCGLSRLAPITGIFVEDHDAAFDELDAISAAHGPVTLTHIDAHADLGLGDPSWVYMSRDILQRPIADRRAPQRGTAGMNLGSWMAFAIAAGMVDSVTFVHPDEGAQDLPPLFFRNCNTQSGFLEMKRFDPALLGPGSPDYMRLCRTSPLQTDPPIPFERSTLDTFRAPLPFNRALLCRSPNYTPASADLLIPVIGECIRF